MQKFNSQFLFYPSWVRKFAEACKRIESDRNYQPGITDQEMLSSVQDENGNTRDISKKDLARIRESARYCIRRAGVFESFSGETIGVVYQARKIAPKYSNQLCGTWRIVDHEMIMVTMQGEYSVHNKEALKEGDWDNPFGRSIECYLAGNPLPISKGLQILPK